MLRLLSGFWSNNAGVAAVARVTLLRLRLCLCPGQVNFNN